MLGTALGPVVYTILIVGLGAAGIAGVTVGLPRAIDNIKKKYFPNGTKKERAKRKAKLEKIRRHELAVSKYVQERNGSRIRTENTTVPFRNRQGKQINYPFAEITTFDETKDHIYRGKLGQYLEDGKYQELGDVYLFQPRLLYKTHDSKTNQDVKQEITPNDAKGVLDNGRTYVINVANENEEFYGYTPKREVLTGKKFDYIDGEFRYCIDASSPQEQVKLEEQESDVRSILKIFVPKDNQGNLIPVDLNDPKEKAAFEEYKRRNMPTPDSTEFYVKLGTIVDNVTNKVKNGFTKRIKGQDLDYSVQPEKKTETKKADQPKRPSYEETMARINEESNIRDKVYDNLARANANGHGPIQITGGRPFGGMPPMTPPPGQVRHR